MFLAENCRHDWRGPDAGAGESAATAGRVLGSSEFIVTRTRDSDKPYLCLHLLMEAIIYRLTLTHLTFNRGLLMIPQVEIPIPLDDLRHRGAAYNTI